MQTQQSTSEQSRTLEISRLKQEKLQNENTQLQLDLQDKEEQLQQHLQQSQLELTLTDNLKDENLQLINQLEQATHKLM